LEKLKEAVISEEQEIQVNGGVYSAAGDPDGSLLGVLRDEIGLMGAKYGCGEAQCGACVVLLDGLPGRPIHLKAVFRKVRETAVRLVALTVKLDRHGWSLNFVFLINEQHTIEYLFLTLP